jgi:hypothetical protein
MPMMTNPRAHGAHASDFLQEETVPIIDFYGDDADELAISRAVIRKNASPKGYWYESDIYYCPVCCSEDILKNRVYDKPRPRKWRDRNHIIEAWDYCDAF